MNAMGFFTKIFPVIALPFMIIYNSKTTSMKEQILHVIKVYGIMTIALILPFVYLVGLNKALNPYIFATGSGLTKEYANTFTFMIYSWLNIIFKSSIDYNTLSMIMSGIMIIIICLLLFISYKSKDIKPVNFIMYIALALFSLIIFSKFHSPQYFMWVMPLFAILVADNKEKIAVFFMVNIFAYIEFPIMFGSFYTNVQYVKDVGTYGWYVALIFFTIEYIIIFLLIKVCSYDEIKESIKYYFNLYIKR